MKTILLSLCIILFTTCLGQTNFKWEKIDTVSKTKEQIFSETKYFIAETWNSSKNIILDEDKDAGIIIIKGESYFKLPVFLTEVEYSYDYNVTFRIKNNKVKMEIDNVYCDGGFDVNRGTPMQKIEPFEGNHSPEIAVSEKKAEELMADLKRDLQFIVDSYDRHIKDPNYINSNW